MNGYRIASNYHIGGDRAVLIYAKLTRADGVAFSSRARCAADGDLVDVVEALVRELRVMAGA